MRDLRRSEAKKLTILPEQKMPRQRSNEIKTLLRTKKIVLTVKRKTAGQKTPEKLLLTE